MTANSMIENESRSNHPMDEEVINLREYWNVIRRHLKSIVAITFIAMVLATLVVFSMKPIYQSTATLLIETESKKILSIEEVYSGGQQSREYLNTQFEVIKSKSLARKVINELNLTKLPYFLPDSGESTDEKSFMDTFKSFWLNLLPETISAWFNNPQQGAGGEGYGIAGMTSLALTSEELLLRGVEEQFAEMMTVSPVRNTQLVHVAFEASNNQLAALLANEMAQMYISDQMDARLEMTAQANSWLTDRLSNIREKLRQSELGLQDYREKEKLLESGGVTGLVSRQLQELNEALMMSQKKHGDLEAANNQIRQIKSGKYQDFLSIPAVLADSLVSLLLKDESDKRQELGTLGKRYGPKHPRIISARAALNSATTALRNHVLSVVEGINNQFELAVSSKASTEGILQKTKRELQNINRKQHQLGMLQREVDADRQMYDLFLNRIKETTESTGIDKANARIVDIAIAAVKPVKPKKKLIILIAGFLGLGFGVLMAFLFEHLNNTVKTAVDLEEQLKVAVLGALPLIKGKDEEVWRTVQKDPRSAYTEGIRTIRTGVILSGLDNPHKIIMVTSSVPDEGKSSTASNFAINLSEMHKVLLIDADLRKPTVGRLFGLPAGANGLSEMLAETVEKNNCLHRWEDSQLYILPSGALPANPLDMLSSAAFQKSLGILSKHFDHIIIDTPPVLPVSDSRIISTLVNGVIFVIKSDATPVPVVKEGLKRLHQSNAVIIGGVLNQFNPKKHQQYGEYSYSSGYYSED